MYRFTLLVLACAACRLGFDVPAGPDAMEGAGDAPPGSGRVAITVSGAGAVVGTAIACTDSCDVDAAGPIELRAVAHESWSFTGWTGSSCTQPTCIVDPDTQITATFTQDPITANIAFITSGNAPRSGLAALDNLCTTSATTAGLAGTFVAFVSTTTIDARDRIAGARGWVRMDGLPYLDQPAELGDASMPRALVLTELGAASASTMFQTGSTAMGVEAGHCMDWTSTSSTMTMNGALVHRAGASAIGGSSTNCSSLGPIACFQTDRNVPVDLSPEPFPLGRYLFVTEQPFVLAGVAAADAQCQSEATAAALPGTYRAMITTTTESITTRIGGLGGTWRRPDGMVIARTGLDQGYLQAAALLDATGLPWGGNQALHGGINATDAGSMTCADWTSTAGFTTVFYPNTLRLMTEIGSSASCASSWRLMCAQLP